MELLHWAVAVVAMAAMSLGLGGLSKAVLAIVASGVGFACLVYTLAASGGLKREAGALKKTRRLGRSADEPWEDYHRPRGPVCRSGSPDISAGRKDQAVRESITGHAEVDVPLNEVFSYIFRDYVYSWHLNLTHSGSFPAEAEDCLRRAAANLADRIKAVDWIPFLTQRLVDDAASHVRLFKRAKSLLKSRLKEDCKAQPTDLESMFFDAEVTMEKTICRDQISSIQQEELNYLQSLTDILLFLLLPQQDFDCSPTRTLVREVVVNQVLQPMLTLFSEPDFINQNIVFLHSEYKIKYEVFSNALRCSESVEELQATREMVSEQISYLRSNDSKGDLDSTLKQQLNSLLYLRKVIDGRVHRIQSGSDSDSFGLPTQIDWNQTIGPGLDVFILPLEVLLKNNVAIGYFIDFMTSIGCQSYIFFYLNVEGWKVSAEQQIQALELEILNAQRQQQGAQNGCCSAKGKDQQVPGEALMTSSSAQDGPPSTSSMTGLLDNMREAAHSIYEEYLSEKANQRLKLDETASKRLLFKIRTEPPNPDWFDEVQLAVFDKLQKDERFQQSFVKSVGYVKLLAELDLLKDPAARSSEDDEDEDSRSLTDGDEFSIYDSLSLNSYESTGGQCQSQNIQSRECFPEDTGPTSVNNKGSNFHSGNTAMDSRITTRAAGLSTEVIESGAMTISASIVDVSTVKEGVMVPYAMYTLLVTIREAGKDKEDEVKRVCRRYSDFHALHQQVCERHPRLSKLPFPSKKTFGNMDRQVLEKRRQMLDAYIKELLKPDTLRQNFGLVILLERFLDHSSNYQRERQMATNNVIKATVGSVRSSVQTVKTAVTSVPSNIIYTVDSVVDGLTKAFQSKQASGVIASAMSQGKVGAGLDVETSGNIPLRILLLFMDEVFDLHERNQWLRRQIVSVLRQLIKAMLGDIVNRKIVEYFAQATSPEVIGAYIKSLKDSLWPNGYPAAMKVARDENTKMRTRVAARAALYSGFLDDLRRVIGSETTRTGLMMLFEMLQHPVLNKRLAIVIMEGILQTLFHDQDFGAILSRLHSNSGRVRNELKNSQRSLADLIRR